MRISAREACVRPRFYTRSEIKYHPVMRACVGCLDDIKKNCILTNHRASAPSRTSFSTQLYERVLCVDANI